MRKIGLITGGGTGIELGNYFKIVCDALAKANKFQIDIIEYPHIFKTYYGIAGFSDNDIRQVVKEDYDQLIKAYKLFYESECKVIFRTAINAETLYLARMKVKGIKIVPIQLGNYTLTLVRDMMQGFYSNDIYSIAQNEVRFESSFSEDKFSVILRYIRDNLGNTTGYNNPNWFLYKHHLFGTTLEKWIKKQLPNAEVYQPDTGIDKLFRYLEKPVSDLLLITGNEIGDIIHEVIILHLKKGYKNTLYTKNIFLADEFSGLTEYQTVHGSVDDLIGTGRLNPTAMLRALGAIFQNELGAKNAEKMVNRILDELKQSGISTPDEGGLNSTEDVINSFINKLNNLNVKQNILLNV